MDRDKQDYEHDRPIYDQIKAVYETEQQVWREHAQGIITDTVFQDARTILDAYKGILIAQKRIKNVDTYLRMTRYEYR